MKGRILNIVLVLVLVTLPMAANAGWSEAQQATDQTLPEPSEVEETSTPDVDVKGSPVMFIENVGQWDEGARFQVWGGPAGTMWLAEDAIWITVLEPEETSRQVDKALDPVLRWPSEDREDPAPRRGVNIKLSFVGANPHPSIQTFDRLNTTVSYFTGKDTDQWHRDVPVWDGVRYVELYPGVDLDLTSEGGQIAPRLAARPGANLDSVRLHVDGADTVAMDGDVLRLSTAAGKYSLPLLRVDERQDADSQVETSGAQAFDVVAPFAPTNSNRQSKVEYRKSPADNPADLLYGTFLGGSQWDDGSAITVDGTGSAYVTGWTNSTDFPTTPGAFDPSYNGGSAYSGDAFVAKLNSTGSDVVYTTFLGGSDSDNGSAIAVDETGSAYVTGSTMSAEFPITSGSFDTSHNGSSDAFVVKLNPTGSELDYATFLGGSGSDTGRAVVINAPGSAFVTGSTTSSGFPTTPGSFDTSHNGGSDAFVVKLNPTGSELDYATFLGASGSDYGRAVVIDSTGSAYGTGETSSNAFPTTSGAFDPSFNGNDDAFVFKLDVTGGGLAYATFLGGSSLDYGLAIAVDAVGNAHVTGYTLSGDFPTTPGAFDPSQNGDWDAFVVKLNSTGDGLNYATFLGGNGYDRGNAIVVDGTGNAHLAGYVASDNFPTTPDAFDTSYNGGGGDAFVARLNPIGSALTYATFLGGDAYEEGKIVLDEFGRAYGVGFTASSDFPTTPSGFDTNYNGGSFDAFVVKLAMGSPQNCCDFDGDGTVDVDDLVIIGDLWNQPATAPFDQDGDGLITIVDIQRVARWWGWPIP